MTILPFITDPSGDYVLLVKVDKTCKKNGKRRKTPLMCDLFTSGCSHMARLPPTYSGYSAVANFCLSSSPPLTSVHVRCNYGLFHHLPLPSLPRNIKRVFTLPHSFAGFQAGFVSSTLTPVKWEGNQTQLFATGLLG